MSDISRPFVRDDDPDRHIRCQDAIQFAFRKLLDDAMEAGWSEREVAAAIMELAENHALSLQAFDQTDALIALLKRMT